MRILIPLFHFTISALLTIFQIIPSSSAYYTIFLREIGPEWFMSYNYFMTATNLHSRNPSPTACYDIPLSHHKDALTVLGFYNKPGEVPATALAVYPYNNPRCGGTTPLGAAIVPNPPSFVVVLDPNDLYGLHVVDVERLGIRWYRGTIQALNVTAERIDPNGLLYGLPEHPGSGLYVWEGDPETSYKTPTRRVYLPNTVEKVAEPRDFLRKMDIGGESKRLGYIYMRDLMERYIRPETRDLKDNISPWIDENNAGMYEGMRMKPVMNGPLYNKKDTSLRNTNRRAWQRVTKRIPHLEEKRAGKGWTLVYQELEKGLVPGMEYYDAKLPILLDLESSEGSNAVYGEQPDQENLSGDPADMVYVYMPDEMEVADGVGDGIALNPDQNGISQILLQMQRLHENPPGTTLVESGGEEERLTQNQDPGNSIEPQLSNQFPPQSAVTNSSPETEIKEEAREEPGAIDQGIYSDPNRVNDNQPPNRMLEEIQAMQEGPISNIERLEASLRAQQEGLVNQNEPGFSFSSTGRGRDRRRMPTLEDLVEYPEINWSSTSSRARQQQAQNFFQEEERPDRSLEDYEDYYDPQGRNLRNRGSA